MHLHISTRHLTARLPTEMPLASRQYMEDFMKAA
jgi:hypothetical protein